MAINLLVALENDFVQIRSASLPKLPRQAGHTVIGHFNWQPTSKWRPRLVKYTRLMIWGPKACTFPTLLFIQIHQKHLCFRPPLTFHRKCDFIQYVMAASPILLLI